MRPAVWAALALSLTAGSGCLGYLHPVEAPHGQLLDTCQAVPKACRNHVHVFLMNGLDPVNYGDLTGLRDYITDLGFQKTYYGQLYHYWWIRDEVRHIHKEDPDARFVLIGFSLGANLMYSVAHSVEADGIQIDLLVFVSGNHPVCPMPKQKPDNVLRVLNLLASGLLKTRGERDWAENVRLSDTNHFDAPTHPQTLEMLAQELAMLAASMPQPPAAAPMPPAADDEPTPRPVTAQPAARRDAWDFLKPVSNLHMPPAPDKSKEQKPAVDPERIALR
jgi:hypothetical protein